MKTQIIGIVVNFIVTGLLGYLVATLKNFKKIKKEKDNAILEDIKQLKESQLCDMRSDLSNKFYIYDAMDEVEDYLAISWQEKCERYFNLGGNNYLHSLYEKSKRWKIKPTGYLQ